MGTQVVRRWSVSALFLLCAVAWDTPARAQGAYWYVFGGPGAAQCCGEAEGMLHVGGGVEFVTSVGLGVGAEIGFLGPWEAFGDGVGVFSTNGVYYVRRRGSSSRFSPFVTGGYSHFFRDWRESMWNAGGGMHVRMSERLALRVEARDHFDVNHGETVHFWGARVGLTIGSW